MAKKGVVEVVIAGDESGLTSALGAASSGLSTLAIGAAGLGAAIVAGVAGAGYALYNLGGMFDSASDKIRVGTGATGVVLEELKGSFDNVVTSVPTDFDSASTAIADLNTRLGLTGPELEDMSKKFLELSRLTGGDVETNIANITRVFGDWSIASEDQSGSMDKLFRASQATGISIESLSSQVVAFGAPLRGLGFSFEDSVAMLSKWEKEGVNVENVMGAMKKGFGEFSKEFGERAPEEFRKFITELQNAPDAAAAAQLAIEKLGVRNGPDFAAAVQEGRFAYDDLLGVINDGEDTIMQASSDTESFGEKFTILKNKAFVALEPLATKLFETFGQWLEQAEPYFEQARIWLEENLPIWLDNAAKKWEEWWPTIKDVLANLWTFLTDTVPNAIQTFMRGWEVVWPQVQEIWDKIYTKIETVWLWLEENVLPGLTDAFNWLVEVWRGILEWAEENWPGIQEAITTAFDRIKTVVETVWGWIQTFWENGGQQMFDAAKNIWGQISDTITTVIDVVKGIIETIINLFNGDWSEAWESFKGVVDTAWEWIKASIGRAIDWVVGTIAGIGGLIWGAIQGAWDGLVNTFKGAVNKIIEYWNMIDFGIDFTVPDWVPGVGGNHYGVDDIVPDIAYLAKGGVVDEPTFAMIGEGRGPNPTEIVTPEDLLTQIFRRELGNMLQELVPAMAGAQGGPRELVVSLDGEVLARKLMPKVRKQVRSRGEQL